MGATIIYFIFAVVHPLSELWERTSLAAFLNRVYYRSERDHFPVGRIRGVGGSLLVLGVLLAAPYHETAWCFAAGLAVADLVQHFVHAVRRPGHRAPRIHLVTIIGVLVPLLFVIDQPSNVLGRGCLVPLALGAGVIFGNWSLNSYLTGRAEPRRHPASS